MTYWGDQQGFLDSNGSNNRSRSRSRSRSRDNSQENRPGPGRPKASMPREREIQPLERQDMNRSGPQWIGIQLSCAFLLFFEQIDKRKGFLMKLKDRVDLQRQQTRYKEKQLPRIEWTRIAQWNNIQESDKLDSIFQRKILSLQPSQIQDLKVMFMEVSSMFGKEASSELYQILLQAFLMCIKSQRDSQKAVQDLFVDQLKNSEQYYFLNFKFSNIKRLQLKQNYDDAYRRLGRLLHKHMSIFLASNKW